MKHRIGAPGDEESERKKRRITVVSPEETAAQSTGNPGEVVGILDNHAHRTTYVTINNTHINLSKMTVPTKGATNEPAPTVGEHKNTKSRRTLSVTANASSVRDLNGCTGTGHVIITTLTQTELW